MRKNLMILMALLLALASCKNARPEEKTVLFIGTPYQGYPEMLNGRVQKMVEKNYWAVPEGEKFKRGNPITLKDKDSVQWTNDFEVIFDETGDLMSCNEIDENGKTIRKNDMLKENGRISTNNYFFNDTLRNYGKWTYDNSGNPADMKYYNASSDTLLYAAVVKYSNKKDTVTYTSYNSKGMKGGWSEYIYDDQGRIKSYKYYNKTGAFSWGMNVNYNEKGKMSELIFIDKENKPGSSNSFTYEYDEKGNWTRAVVTDDKGRHFIEERTYTYFE